ncbi:unnamed protein product [marine sediment metagenome]|uniref:Uncharacterized protein n=1 Tax=marine sediment metagenome TaxID=412755 RepID=X0V0P5_9ZZZZ
MIILKDVSNSIEGTITTITIVDHVTHAVIEIDYSDGSKSTQWARNINTANGYCKKRYPEVKPIFKEK